MEYYIKIGETSVPVTEEIYKAYCQGERKERYFRESDQRNQLFSYDALDTEELNGSEMFCNFFAESVEELAEKHWLLDRLKEGVRQLSQEEQEMLFYLYSEGISLRALAREKEIPVTTLHSRHQKLLKKLKKYLEK